MQVEVIYDDTRYHVWSETRGKIGGLSRATERSAGHDLRSGNQDIILQPYEKVSINTGIRVNMPQNHAVMGMVVLRSSIGKRGVKLANQVGIIDADYQGHIYLVLENLTTSPITITCFERIAQIMFVPVYLPEFVEVNQFLEHTDRGEGGFGSTGKD